MRDKDSCIISTVLGENTKEFEEAASQKIREHDLNSMLTVVSKGVASFVTKNYNLKIASIFIRKRFLEAVVDILDNKRRLTKTVECRDKKINEAENLLGQMNDLLVLLLNICRLTSDWRWEIAVILNKLTAITKHLQIFVGEYRCIALYNLLKQIRQQVNYQGEKHSFDNISNLEIIPTKYDIERNSFAGLHKNITRGPFRAKQDYLKIHFHLLREDFIMPLREGIRELKEKLHSDRLARKVKNLRVYHNVQTSRYFYENGEKTFELLLNINTKFRISAGRLKYGTLVGLSTDYFETYQFAVVNSNDELQRGIIKVTFETDDDTSLLRSKPILMIEPVSEYFKSYRHTLEVLQKFAHQPSKLPLEEYIVFCKTDVCSPKYLEESVKETYSVESFTISETGSSFSYADANDENNETFRETGLESSSNSQSNYYEMSQMPNCSSNEMLILASTETALSEISSFDEYQMEAFKTAISNEISVIQGPPGCGKTFLGLQIVHHLSIKTNLKKLGYKLMIVCYTNHALDQFLEGLFATHRADMVRIGNRSRSAKIQSITLKQKRVNFVGTEDECNLRNLCKKLKHEISHLSSDISTTIIKIDILKNNILNTSTLEKEMGPFYDIFNWCKKKSDEKGNSVLCEWLLGLDVPESLVCSCFDPHPFYVYKKEHVALCLNCGEAAKLKNKILQKLMEVPAVYNEDLDSELNILNSCFQENLRWGLYRGWVENYCYRLETANSVQINQVKDLKCRVNDIAKALDKQIIKKHFIIGITTTSAAENWDILQDVRPAVVIAEESAEVLESHLLASLSSGCQQLILIGDHKQLRPHVSVKTLADQYGLEISMFERLVMNNLHCTQLRVQHRMRPEISDNLRYIYENLEDHNIVKHYDSIRGVSKNLFWIDHACLEDEKHEMESFKNKHEAMYLVSLCNYLLFQGYKSTEITILTLYKGQMIFIRQEIRHRLREPVRVDTVDNFQGEENEIILLSLVRSNKKYNPGFTVNENRICVALSRAKRGLYIMGNSDTICKRNSLWEKIYQKMKRNKLVSEALKLVCSNHPEQTLRAKTPEDFSKWSNGGCTLPCKKRLSCGHACLKSCHASDRDHRQTCCTRPCLKLCKRGHKCKRLCNEPCSENDCEEKIKFLHDQCGHVIEILCTMEERETRCSKKCEKKLPCGHSCNKLCKEVCSPCREKVTYMRNCGHEGVRECSEAENTDVCLEPCDKQLACGHFCGKLCKDTCLPCTEIISYKRTCGHSGFRKCHEAENSDTCKFIVSVTKQGCQHKIKTHCYKRNNPCSVITSYLRTCNHLGKRACHKTVEVGQCQEKVQFIKQDCGHLNEKLCFQKESDISCDAVCGLKLDCGHRCESKCSSVFTKSLYCSSCNNYVYCSKGHFTTCTQTCGEQLLCGHRCSSECLHCNNVQVHKTCGRMLKVYQVFGHEFYKACGYNEKPVCTEDPNFSCKHGKNAFCDKACPWQCEHIACFKSCGDVCDRPQCYQPCTKRLKCGHPCVGMCGDPCPKLCKICQIDCFLGFNSTDRFVQLPQCGDLIRVDFMDKYMKLDCKTIAKVCPICRSVICVRNGNRYEGIINAIRKTTAIEIQKERISSRLYQNFDALVAKIRDNIACYVQAVSNVKLNCLDKLTCRSVQNIKDIERLVQKKIDSEYLTKLINQLGDGDLLTFQDHLNAACDILDTPGRFGDKMHKHFSLFMRESFGDKAKLDLLVEIKFECITLKNDTVTSMQEMLDNKIGEKGPDGIHHINVIVQSDEYIKDWGLC